MKLFVFIVIVAVLILLGGGIYVSTFLNTLEPGVSTEEEQVTTPSLFLVTPLQTIVSLKESDSEKFVELPGERKTIEGASVRTSETGRAVIESGDAINMILDRKSEVTIAQLENEGRKTSIRLHGGALWARIEKVLEQGEFFEIETQNMVASVRGTSFSVSYKNGITTVLVHEGAVITTAIDPETRERLHETSKIVPAGKKSIRKGGNGIVVTDITDTDRATEWYKPAIQNEFNRTTASSSAVAPTSSPEKTEDPKPDTSEPKTEPEPVSQQEHAPMQKTTQEPEPASEQQATILKSVESPTHSSPVQRDNTRLQKTD